MISQGVRDHLIRDFHVSPQRARLIYNGIDLYQFQLSTSHDRQLKRKEYDVQGEPILGIIARLSSVKGIDVLIKAMPDILNVFPRTQLWIVGEGPEEAALKRLAVRLNVGDRIVFKPIVNRTSVILPIFDIFVMPSIQEGLGLSVMEAQAAGIPVVASNVGGLPDVVDDGRSGILVTPGQSRALAEKIIFLLQNPSLAQSMAREARMTIQEKFSLDQMVDKTVLFYEENLRC